MADEPQLTELGQKTLQRLNSALEGGALAGVPEVIRLIQELSSKAFSISITELSDLISQDVTVTAKVLSAANTVGYNPNGVSVNTIGQAIQVIGFERVRNLAISLLLAENAERLMSTEEQREVCNFALSSGLLAQTLMAEFGSADPEETFVCTALRNYGRLLMTAYLIDDYRLAQNQAASKGEDEAFREIFGLTPLGLSYHLLMSANLPKEILAALRGIAPHVSPNSILKPEEEVVLMSGFAVRICELAANGAISPEVFRHQALSILGEYGDRITLDPEGLETILQSTVSKLRSFAQSFGVKSMTTGTTRMLLARSEGKRPPPDLAKFRMGGSRDGKAPPPATPDKPRKVEDELVAEKPHAGPTAECRIQNAIETIRGLLEARPVDVVRIHAEALAAMREALALSDVLLFERSADGSFALAAGVGPLFENLRGRANLISRERRDVFGVSLNRGEDVLVEDAKIPKFRRYLPLWMQSPTPPQSVILLPVAEGEAVAAMLCGSRQSGPSLTVDHGTLQALKLLRPLMVQARAASAAKSAR